MTTNSNIKHTKRLLPGMLCNSVEFFNYELEVKVIMNGTIKKFYEPPTPIYQLLNEEMHRHPKAFQILKDWHPESESKQIETFARCRYGDLENTGDIVDGKFSSAEFWDCPLRGSCKGEGIICALPNYKGETLSGDEVQLLKMLTTAMTNDAIAGALTIALGTFHQLKQKLYAKLGGIQTKQEATIKALELNII